jgi:hypothetical protein
MRARVVIALLAAGAGAAACIDLFHSTDFDTLCVVDAAACPDGGDGAPPGDGPNSDGGPGDDGPNPGDGGADVDSAIAPTDFCAWDASTSHESARRACALVGACLGPYGTNELGKCFENALRAYDCQMNPSFPLFRDSDVHRYWDCLQKARSCADVTHCVFPNGEPSCSVGSSILCAGTTRMDCVQMGMPPIAAESCTAVGQLCGTECTLLDGGCKPLGCEGAILHDCSGTAERGRDCASYGARACKDVALATDAGADAAMSTCAPTPSTGCSASPNVTCNGGVASACFTGTAQTLDCRALMEDAGTCDPTAGAGEPIWELSRYCIPSAPGCTESCDAGVITGCHRNRPIVIDCKTYVGTTTCVADPIGTGHPACAKP